MHAQEEPQGQINQILTQIESVMLCSSIKIYICFTYIHKCNAVYNILFFHAHKKKRKREIRFSFSFRWRPFILMHFFSPFPIKWWSHWTVNYKNCFYSRERKKGKNIHVFPKMWQGCRYNPILSYPICITFKGIQIVSYSRKMVGFSFFLWFHTFLKENLGFR